MALRMEVVELMHVRVLSDRGKPRVARRVDGRWGRSVYRCGWSLTMRRRNGSVR